MSVNQQVQRMSGEQFQVWAQSQIKTVAGNRLQYQDPNSLQQCDDMLQEWGQHQEQVNHHERALRETTQAQQGLRTRFMEAIANLTGSSTSQQHQPQTTPRFQPPRKRSASSNRSSVPTPLTAPVVNVVAPHPGQHVITFQFSGPRGSQPAGSSGAEIYIAFGEECPTTDSGFRFAAWATRSPHVMRFNEKDAGRMAHYRLRWINAKGETGPWSIAASAVIPAVSELV